MLGQRALEVLHGVCEVALLLVCAAHAAKGLGDDLEVGHDLATMLDGGLAVGNTGVVVTLLEVSGAAVCEVGDVLVCLPGLGVVCNGLVE